jgi:hypothetical protein
MILTTTILREAEKWLGCTETKQNRSACVDEIHKAFNPNWAGSPDAWCAKFVWTMVEAATKKLNVPNPLFKSASTVQMLNKTNLRKDDKSAKGSIFFIERSCAGGGCGHVGFVERVDGNIIHTIEGNTGGPEGVYRQKRDTSKQKFTFIHIEDLDTIENNLNAILPFDLTIDDSRLWTVAVFATVGIVGAVIYAKRK